MTGVDPAFARSVARWLRAYPRRWRAVRGEEITAVLADLAPGARRLDLRSGLGLLRAGWATRWREHPPPLPYLGYVLLELRMDPRYRDWVRDDVEGAWFTARRVLVSVGVVAAVTGLPALLGVGGWTPGPVYWGTFVPALLLGVAFWARHVHQRVVARQLVVQAGETVTRSTVVPGLVARPRLAVRPWLAAARLVALVTLGMCTVLVLLAPERPALRPCDGVCVDVRMVPAATLDRGAALLVLALGGLVGLLVARRSARRRLAEWRPMEQPDRWLVPLGPLGRTRLLAALGGAVWLVVALPWSGATLAVPAGALAAAALPVIATTRRVVDAGGTAAVAGIDVVRALRRQPDRGDAPVAGHLPAADWLPLGSVVPVPGDPDAGPGTEVARRG